MLGICGLLRQVLLRTQGQVWDHSLPTITTDSKGEGMGRKNSRKNIFKKQREQKRMTSLDKISSLMALYILIEITLKHQYCTAAEQFKAKSQLIITCTILI